MIAKSLVVIGASAGGIDTLCTILAGMPDPFPAAICIVLHMSPDSPGLVPQILDRAGRLRVAVAFDGQRLEAGTVYVAPPDRHLLVEPGKLRVTRGPREHRFRPAIDPLFRSAGQVFGPAAIGVILTGHLDDGTAGLWTIKKLGGVTVVQDPSDAVFPSMPMNAVRHVDVDYVVPAPRIPSLLVELTSNGERATSVGVVPPQMDVEIKIAKEEDPHVVGLEKIGRPSTYSCPDCSGVLMEIDEGGRLRFRCHTGHAYSTESLLAAMNVGIDEAMGAAVRALEEARLLTREVATQLKQHNHLDASRRLEAASDRAKRRAEAIRELILERDPVPTADE